MNHKYSDIVTQKLILVLPDLLRVMLSGWQNRL